MNQKNIDINKQAEILEKLLKRPDNLHCADCCSKVPRWASITFGVFVCIRCSGKPLSILRNNLNQSNIGVHR